MAYAITRLDTHDYGGATLWVSSDGAEAVPLYLNPTLCDQFAQQAGYPITEINRDDPPAEAVAWADSVLGPLAQEEIAQHRLAVAMGTLEADVAAGIAEVRQQVDAQLRADPELDPATLTASARAALVEGLV